MSSPQRGAFIVIEGLDRSGKSTQAAALLERLQESVPAKLIKFPDRTTPIGKLIDAYLRSESEVDDRAIHLLFSANRWELASSIENILASGTTIVSDRYAFSGIAFSASKGLPFEWCRAPDISLPAPDLTLFFEISPELAKQRGGYGEERYEKEEIQRRVHTQFGNIASEFPRSGTGGWVTIDAGRDKQAVFEEVWNHVQSILPVKNQLGKLWSGCM